MSAKVIKLEDFQYKGSHYDFLWVILDRRHSPSLLPFLFSTYLSNFGIVYHAQETTDVTLRKRFYSLVPEEINSPTIRSYVYCLSNFLTYLDNSKTIHETPGMHSSADCSERVVRHYLNNELPNQLDSVQSLELHRSALLAYFNWLDYIEIRPRFDLNIYRRTRQLIAAKSNKQHYIQYVSRYWRIQLLNACSTLAQKLTIRLGFEVGLRTSELRGVNISKEGKLLTQFRQLESKDYHEVSYYRYWLHGRYAKGGKSRWIYFNRQLMLDLKRYYETERQWIVDQTGSKDHTLILKNDNRFKGTGIGKSHGSNIFRKLRKQVGLNPLIKYHDLRHTFATELFHSELENPDGRETRSESAALIVVAQRLGHAFANNGQVSPVTAKYVRMRIQMLEFEDSSNE